MRLLGEDGTVPPPKKHADKTILITPGAGGVGSIAIQLAKKVLGFGTVIATASRPETEKWCKELGLFLDMR